ncbi:hypothetical protein F5887DRAFT_124163 [Amanita rubescens]|jgi:hypothetical protein|nr:hypothetical protein F5887DRAFT_124163 [Amanita rubescens]
MSNPLSRDIPKTFGALLLGALFGSFLSGATTVQTIVYLKLYPEDHPFTKGLVTVIWMLDVTHTALTWGGIWTYLISDFGDADKINTIPLAVSLTIIFTAILTILVHFYYVHRIFHLSRRKYWLCLPIVVLAVCRLCSACSTSAEMIRLGTFTRFKSEFRWLFSLGLSLSSAVDVIITLSLFTLLYMSRSKSLSLNNVIDSLILYTFEIGSLTGFATIVSMICWLAVKDTLIFMGLHFIIAKLYANSFLASLNTRHQLRQAHARTNSATNAIRGINKPSGSQQSQQKGDDIQLQRVEVNVEKNIQYDDDAPVTVQFIGAHKSTTALVPRAAS